MIVIERELDRIDSGYKIQNPYPFFPVTSFILPVDSLEPSIMEVLFLCLKGVTANAERQEFFRNWGFVTG